MLRFVTEENKDEVLQAVTCPYLTDCMKKLVNEWKDLTDEEWSGFQTLRMGSWIVRDRRTGRSAKQEAQDREEHQLMRRGVNILKGVEWWMKQPMQTKQST